MEKNKMHFVLIIFTFYRFLSEIFVKCELRLMEVLQVCRNFIQFEMQV